MSVGRPPAGGSVHRPLGGRPAHAMPGLPVDRRIVALGVLGLYALALALSVFLVRLQIAGVPLRVLPVLAILGLVFLLDARLLFRALRERMDTILVVALAAVIGVIVSLSNGLSIASLIRQLFEIHVQAVFGVITGTLVIALCGARANMATFVAVVAVSTAFATLQFLGVELAWAAYDFLSTLQPTSLQDLQYYDYRARPMGLSYSPVHLGTQLCLVAAVALLYITTYPGPTKVVHRPLVRALALIAAVTVGSLVSGNRSPILGFAVLAGLLALHWRPALSLLGVAAALALLPFASDLLAGAQEATGLRVLDTENKSSQGREALRALGLMLFADRPLGYGLGFNSVDHAWQYWDRLRFFENANASQAHALHNYYLVVLNKYGASILLLSIALAVHFRRNWLLFVCFVPYAIHIYYHNDGPLQGDFMVFFLLPLFCISRGSTPATLAACLRR